MWRAVLELHFGQGRLEMAVRYGGQMSRRQLDVWLWHSEETSRLEI